MMKKILVVALALPLVLFLLLIAGVYLVFLPPLVSWASVVIMALVLLWLLLRRRSGMVSGSESALMGSHSSKDGLL